MLVASSLLGSDEEPSDCVVCGVNPRVEYIYPFSGSRWAAGFTSGYAKKVVFLPSFGEGVNAMWYKRKKKCNNMLKRKPVCRQHITIIGPIRWVQHIFLIRDWKKRKSTFLSSRLLSSSGGQIVVSLELCCVIHEFYQAQEWGPDSLCCVGYVHGVGDGGNIFSVVKVLMLFNAHCPLCHWIKESQPVWRQTMSIT